MAEAIARLNRVFVEAAPADRIVVRVLRSQFLIAEAAHRTAAAGIEAPRRRELLARGAEDRADAQPAGQHDAVRHRIIAARLDLGAPIGREIADDRPFALDDAGQPATLRRIEQAVGALNPPLSGQVARA